MLSIISSSKTGAGRHCPRGLPNRPGYNPYLPPMQSLSFHRVCFSSFGGTITARKNGLQLYNWSVLLALPSLVALILGSWS